MVKFLIACTNHRITDVRVTFRFLNFFQKKGDVIWLGPFSKVVPDILKLQPEFLSGNRLQRNYQLFLAIRRNPSEFIYVPDPDALFTTLVARRKGTKIIFDIHERFHDDLLNLSYPNMNIVIRNVISKVILRILNFGVNRSDYVIGVGPSRLNCFKVGAEKRLIFGHYVMKEYFTSSKLDLDKSEQFNILFGKPLASRGVHEALQSLALLIKWRPKLPINLVLIGTSDYEDRLRSLISELNLIKHVTFIDPLRYEDMFKLINSCQLGIISYARDLGVYCVPNRFFEYSTMSLDFIYPSYAQDLTYFSSSANCGFAVDTENPVEVAKAIESRYMEWEENKLRGDASKKAQHRYSWEMNENQLLKFLNI